MRKLLLALVLLAACGEGDTVTTQPVPGPVTTVKAKGCINCCVEGFFDDAQGTKGYDTPEAALKVHRTEVARDRARDDYPDPAAGERAAQATQAPPRAYVRQDRGPDEVTFVAAQPPLREVHAVRAAGTWLVDQSRSCAPDGSL